MVVIYSYCSSADPLRCPPERHAGILSRKSLSEDAFNSEHPWHLARNARSNLYRELLAVNRETRLQAVFSSSSSIKLVRAPPLSPLSPRPPPPLETVSDSSPNAATTVAVPVPCIFCLNSSVEEEKEKRGEEVLDEAFITSPSIAPAMLQISRAGRKRASTMKALIRG